MVGLLWDGDAVTRSLKGCPDQVIFWNAFTLPLHLPSSTHVRARVYLHDEGEPYARACLHVIMVEILDFAENPFVAC